MTDDTLAEKVSEYEDDDLVRELDRRMEVKREARVREAQLAAELFAANQYAELKALMRYYKLPEDAFTLQNAYDFYCDLGAVLEMRGY